MKRLFEVTNGVHRDYDKKSKALNASGTDVNDEQLKELLRQRDDQLDDARKRYVEHGDRKRDFLMDKAAADIAMIVNERILERLQTMMQGQVNGNEISFIMTEPVHVKTRTHFQSSEALTELTRGIHDIVELRELIADLVSCYVVQGDIPPLQVDYYRSHGDIKFTFELPY